MKSKTNDIMIALQHRFDSDYGPGLSGFSVEGGDRGVLFVYDRRGDRDIYYKIGVKFSNAEGKYNCKLDKFDYLTNNKEKTFRTASINPQEIVDFTTHKIHSKAKSIPIE